MIRCRCVGGRDEVCGIRFCGKMSLLLDAMKDIENQIMAFCRLGSRVPPQNKCFHPQQDDPERECKIFHELEDN